MRGKPRSRDRGGIAPAPASSCWRCYRNRRMVKRAYGRERRAWAHDQSQDSDRVRPERWSRFRGDERVRRSLADTIIKRLYASMVIVSAARTQGGPDRGEDPRARPQRGGGVGLGQADPRRALHSHIIHSARQGAMGPQRTISPGKVAKRRSVSVQAGRRCGARGAGSGAADHP